MLYYRHHQVFIGAWFRFSELSGRPWLSHLQIRPLYMSPCPVVWKGISDRPSIITCTVKWLHPLLSPFSCLAPPCDLDHRKSPEYHFQPQRERERERKSLEREQIHRGSLIAHTGWEERKQGAAILRSPQPHSLNLWPLHFWMTVLRILTCSVYCYYCHC